MELLVVRAALGTSEEMGQRVSDETKAMRMPGVRIEGDDSTASIFYDSVRAGPHRPFRSGSGENGCDASVVHIVYEARELYPAYVVEIELAVDPEVAAADEQESMAEASSSNGPASKRRRTASPGASSSSNAALPPSSTLGGVMAALRVKPGDPAMLRRLAALCRDDASMHAQAVESGALPLVVAGMADVNAAEVQQTGSIALHNICYGTDAAGLARKQAAVDAGALTAVVDGMRSHVASAKVQQYGSLALANICHGTDPAAPARRRAALNAGATEALATAAHTHPSVLDAVRRAQRTLRLLTRRT